MDKKEIFYYDSWFKNTFDFYNKDKSKRLTFTPYYRSDIGKEITVEQAEKEGCENIEVTDVKNN
jgi:hypothetical protein